MRRAATAALILLTLTGMAWSARPRRAGNPLETHSLAEPFVLQGRVTERLAAGPYLYLRVIAPGGEPTWIASVRALASSADDVTVTVVARADTFTSTRLGRSFSPLLFGAVRAASTTTPETP